MTHDPSLDSTPSQHSAKLEFNLSRSLGAGKWKCMGIYRDNDVVWTMEVVIGWHSLIGGVVNLGAVIQRKVYYSVTILIIQQRVYHPTTSYLSATSSSFSNGSIRHSISSNPSFNSK